jgi:hypothetical protein
VKFEGRVQSASLRRVAAALESQPQRAYGRLKPAFDRWGKQWRGKMLGRFRAPLPTPGSSNDTLHNRTGNLALSLSAVVSGSSLNDLTLRLATSGFKYARIQEFGGEIRPKNSKFLTIPTSENLTASGQARFPSARNFISSHPGQTFFLRTKSDGGNSLLLMYRAFKGKRKGLFGPTAERDIRTTGKAVPMFLLVKKVEIPGPKAPSKRRKSRLGFFDTWRDLAPGRRSDLQRVARALGSRA